MADENKTGVPNDLVAEGTVYLHDEGKSNSPGDLVRPEEPWEASQVNPITGAAVGAGAKVLGQPAINMYARSKLGTQTAPVANQGLANYAKGVFGDDALGGSTQSQIQRKNRAALGDKIKTAGQTRGPGVRLGGSQLAPQQTLSQKILSHAPQQSQGVIRGTGTVLGRGIVGATAGYDAADAWNRAQKGDIPGAIVSGIGTVGGLASLAPHPLVRGVGTAVAMGAPALNMYLDQSRKEKERGFAKGGKVVEELPKLLKAAREFIKPTAEEVAAFAPKATKQVKLSEALQNDVNKYLGLHQSDPMGTHGGRMGGTGFSEFQRTRPEHAANEVVWANASEEAANRLARQGKVNNKDVIWTNYVGAPDQHRTNRTVTNNILDEFYKQKLTPEQYDIINKRIAASLDSKKRPYFPQAFDIRDKFAVQELGADTFHRRGELADILGRGKGTSREGYKGLSNFDEILESHRDPRLVGAPTSAVGTRIQEIYPEATRFAPQFHPDYHYPVFGKDRGVSFNAVPQDIAIPDFVNAYRKANVSKSGKPLDPHGNAMFGYMKTPQLITEDYLKWLQSNGMAKGGSVAKKALDAATEAYKAKFTSGFYHGSPSNKIKDFDPTKTPGDKDMITPGATFVTRDKDFAESFLPMGNKGEYKTGATTYPVSVNLGKHFNPHEELGRKLIREYAGNTPLGQQMAKGSWEVLESPDFMKFLRGKGYDSMTVFEGGVPNVAVFEPKNIRGKFAKFDPKDAESPDFMKAEGGQVEGYSTGGKILKEVVEAITKPSAKSHSQDPKVAKALEDYLKGKISQEERIAIVNQQLPLRPWTNLPPAYTDEQIVNALLSNKQPKALAPVPAGMRVGNRLDIPAYTQHGVYVDTTHDISKGNAPISYNRTGHLKDVEFSSKPNQAVRVGLGTKEQALTPMGAEMGSAKSPFALIKGTNIGTKDEEVRRMMAEMLNDPSYAQIGMDPRRHSQFYDKSTGMPVFSAEEKLQSGPLILVPKRGLETTSWDDPRLNLTDFPGKKYAGGGSVDDDNFDMRNPEDRAKFLEKLRVDQVLLNEARRTEPLMRPGTAAGYGQQLMDTGNAMRAQPDQLRVNMPSMQQPLSITDMKNMMAANGYRTPPVTAMGGGNSRQQFGMVNADTTLGNAKLNATLSGQRTPMGSALTNAGVGASVPVGKGHLSGFYETNPENKKDFRSGVRYTRKF